MITKYKLYENKNYGKFYYIIDDMLYINSTWIENNLVFSEDYEYAMDEIGDNYYEVDIYFINNYDITFDNWKNVDVKLKKLHDKIFIQHSILCSKNILSLEFEISDDIIFLEYEEIMELHARNFNI